MPSQFDHDTDDSPWPHPFPDGEDGFLRIRNGDLLDYRLIVCIDGEFDQDIYGDPNLDPTSLYGPTATIIQLERFINARFDVLYSSGTECDQYTFSEP